MYISTIIKSLFLYLDPGSGSMLVGIIVASFAGILYSVRGYWSKFIAKIRGVELDDDDEEEEEE